MSSFHGFVGFDAAVADESVAYEHTELSGELPVMTAPDSRASPDHPRTALQIGLDHGAPREVIIDFLGALGLGEDAEADLLLDFDADDLAAARRDFFVGGVAATPLQKATISSWLRRVTTVLGPRPPSMLDPGFTREVAAPAPRELPSAPEAPSPLPVADHSRAAPVAGLAAQQAFWLPSAKAPAPHPTLFAGAPAVTGVPMRDVVDQTHQGHFVPLSDSEVEDAWVMHVRLTGLRPRPEAEPSPEQLGALRALVRAGAAPFVDFAVWGPFDRRVAKDRRSMGLVFVESAPGQPSLQPRALHGPSCFETWERHWAVFGTAMLALGAAAPGPLSRYRDGIADLHTLYGPALWGLIYRADQTMRSEQWRRMSSESPAGGDWSTIIAGSSYFEDGARQWWWDRHVCKPALEEKPVAALAVVDALEGYRPAQQAPPPARARGEDPPWKKARRGGAARREDAAARAQLAQPDQPAQPAVAAPPGQVKKLGACFDFNAGRCGSVDTPCPAGFEHRCSVCGQRHSAAATPGCRELIDAIGRPKGKNKGKGRGRGRGAGQ